MESILLEMAELMKSAPSHAVRKRRKELAARVTAHVDAEITRRAADLAAAHREAESY